MNCSIEDMRHLSITLYSPLLNGYASYRPPSRIFWHLSCDEKEALASYTSSPNRSNVV